jgi:hypothetical protein
MELLRALALLAEPPGSAHARVAGLLNLTAPEEAAHTETFLFQLPPYASIHLGEEGMLGGEARDRVAGFWRALGWEPPAEADHLAMLLATYATMPAGHARAALLTEHLLPWLPGYLAAVTEVAPAPYPAWASLLGDALRAEAARTPALPTLPLHLREAPPLPDPRDADPQAFLDGLLAPVRTGFVLTRATLRRAADDLGLGLRAGERRYALQALLSQEAAGVLRWLAQEARRAAGAAWEPWTELAGPTARFWLDRAATAAVLLEALSTDASAGVAAR